MSRTQRNLPHWAKDRAAEVRAREDEYESRTFRRVARFATKVEQNRDGAVGSDAHMPHTKAPDGYDTWTTMSGKRWAKDQTHRLNRRVKKTQDIRERLEDDE